MPVSPDLIVGLDPTGYLEITGAQLAQLVNSATPQSDRGLCLLTADVGVNPTVPDAATITKWKRYLWIRQAATSIGVYAWNENGGSDATYLKWQAVNVVGIGPGTIVNSMIADNTIQDVKIVSLDYSKITGAPTGLPPSGTASGDLTGTYPSPSIVAGAVTAAKLATDSVIAAKIADGAVTISKLLSDSVADDMMRANADGTMEFFVPNDLVKATTSEVVITGKANKVPRVSADGTVFTMSGSAVIQSLVYTYSTAENQNTTAMAGDTAANLTTSQKKSSIGDMAITPTDALNKIRITVHTAMRNNASSAWVGIYDNTAAAFVAWINYQPDGDVRIPLSMRYQSGAIGSVAARNYSLYFGSGSATAANVSLCPKNVVMSVTIEEIAA